MPCFYSLDIVNEYKCNSDDLDKLKKKLVLVFNETFSRQLCITSDTFENKEAPFNIALLRRIKSLIQYYPTK